MICPKGIAHNGDSPCFCTEERCTQFDAREETPTGDLNSDAKGSGARKNAGKAMFSLVPMHLLAGVARVLNGGLFKYAEWNWAAGMVWSACFNCAMRHMFKFYYAREELDTETQEHHLDHAICNLLFLKHYLTYYPDGDDRPPSGLFTTDDIEQLFNADAYCKRNGLGPYGGS